MKTESTLPVTTDEGVEQDSVLLLWSLWISEGRRCYSCGRRKPFRDIQLDQVIPSRLGRAEFSAVWSRVAGELTEKGPDDISNLRAGCTDCCSRRLKRDLLPSDDVLRARLEGSARIAEAALRERARLTQNREIAEAVARMIASSPDEFEVLWDKDLNQSLLSTLHAAAGGSNEDSAWERRGAPDHRHLVRSIADAEQMRLLGALHLVTGVDSESIIGEVIASAIDLFGELLADYVEDKHPAMATEPVDWSRGQFTVEWTDAAVDRESCSCEAYVTFDSRLNFSTAVEFDPDSSPIEVDRASLLIDGYAVVEVTIAHGTIVGVTIEEHRARVVVADEVEL